jgi:hypothetical protein
MTQRLSLAADVSIPSDDIESLNLGTEYAWQNTLFLRAGFSSLFIPDAKDGLTAGLGLRLLLAGVNLKIIYTFQYFDRLNSPNWISA